MTYSGVARHFGKKGLNVGLIRAKKKKKEKEMLYLLRNVLKFALVNGSKQ